MNASPMNLPISKNIAQEKIRQALRYRHDHMPSSVVFAWQRIQRILKSVDDHDDQATLSAEVCVYKPTLSLTDLTADPVALLSDSLRDSHGVMNGVYSAVGHVSAGSVVGLPSMQMVGVLEQGNGETLVTTSLSSLRVSSSLSPTTELISAFTPVIILAPNSMLVGRSMEYVAEKLTQSDPGGLRWT